MKKKKYSYVGRRFQDVILNNQDQEQTEKQKPKKPAKKKKDIVTENDVPGRIPVDDLNFTSERGEYNE
jgi:hypothetical protein